VGEFRRRIFWHPQRRRVIDDRRRRRRSDSGGEADALTTDIADESTERIEKLVDPMRFLREFLLCG